MGFPVKIASVVALLLSLSEVAFSKPITKRGIATDVLSRPNPRKGSLQHLSKRFLDKDVITTNFPDPSILDVNGVSYVFATNDGASRNVPFAQNPDFSNGGGWQESDTGAFPVLGSWVIPGDVATQALWAPDVNQLDNGTFLMYYSAVSRQTNQHCVGVAYSQSVTGPYADNASGPLVCPTSDTGGAIDASMFIDSDNTRYIVYKHDGPAANNPSTPLILQSVSADGSSLTSDPVTLLDNAGASDGNNIEAPAIVRSSDGSTYFLFFSSGSTFNDSYTLSYASSTSGVQGPYGNRQVLLDTSTGACGQTFVSPGGADITLLNAQMVFHEGVAGAGSVRTLNTATIAFNGASVSIIC